MDARTVIRATGSGDLIPLAAVMLGYTPAESVAVLLFAGSRAERALRIDLPEPGTCPDFFPQTVISIACHTPGITALAVIVFTEHAPADYEPLAAALLGCADRAGVHVYALTYTCPAGWGDFFEGAPHAPQSQPALPPLPDRLMPAASQHAGAVLPDRDAALAARVADAFPRLGEAPAVDLAEDALEFSSGAPDPVSIAALAAALDQPATLLTFLTQWATDPGTGRRAAAAYDDLVAHGTEPPATFAAILTGDAPRPDPARLRAALNGCRIAAAHAPAAKTAGTLAACAWLAWALGSSTHAADYAHQVPDTSPHHSLARTITTLADRAILPEWAYRP